MWAAVKLASLFILFGLSFISGVFSCITVKCIVSKFGKSKTFKRTISVLNCFAGGVFFATSVIDILPEAREKMEDAKSHWGWTTEYPLTELLMGIGFFIIMTLEHGAHSCCKHHKDKHSQDEGKSGKTALSSEIMRHSAVSYLHTNVKQEPKDDTLKEPCAIVGKEIEDTSCFNDASYQNHGAVDESIDKKCVISHVLAEEPKGKRDVEIMFGDSDKIIIQQEVVIPLHNEVTTEAALQSLKDPSDHPSRTNIRGLVLLTALSVHMIFDGLALGLLNDTKKIWDLLLALSLHKLPVFFTIGLQTLELLKSVPKSVLAICIFSLISPLGIVIGQSIITSGGEITNDTVAAILQGLSIGTFVYVTFFEILQRELESTDHDLLKVFFIVIGFVLMAVVSLAEML